MAKKKSKPVAAPKKKAAKKPAKQFAPHLTAEIRVPQLSVQDQIDLMNRNFEQILKLVKVGPHELQRAEQAMFDPPIPNGKNPDFTADTGRWNSDDNGDPTLLGTVNEFQLNKETVMSMFGTLSAKVEVLSQRQKQQGDTLLELKSGHKQGVRM